jgi:hypothetical protein
MIALCIRASTIGFALGASALFLTTASEARMPIAPLKSEWLLLKRRKDVVPADGAALAAGAAVQAIDGASPATIGTIRAGPVPAKVRRSPCAQFQTGTFALKNGC